MELSAMMAELGTVFVFGLLSSFSHCVGMCGGFVYCYSSQLPKEGRNFSQHLIYNFGRVSTYTVFGAVFGLIGQTTAKLAPFVAWQAIILFLAGAVMLLLSLEMLGLSKWSFGLGRSIEAAFVRMAQKFLRRPQRSLFPLGFVLGAIPCGLVYATGLKAAASGSMFQGALLMLVFGLGTMPAMILLGWLGTKLSAANRNIIYRVSGLIVLLLSLQTMHHAWKAWNGPQTSDGKPAHQCHH